MSHPICERCKQEIKPGTDVDILGPDAQELADKRIFVGEELLIVHAHAEECHEPPPN